MAKYFKHQQLVHIENPAPGFWTCEWRCPCGFVTVETGTAEFDVRMQARRALKQHRKAARYWQKAGYIEPGSPGAGTPTGLAPGHPMLGPS